MAYLGVQGIRQTWTGEVVDVQKKNDGGFFIGVLLVLLYTPTMLYFVGVAGAMCKGRAFVPMAIFGAASLFAGAFACFVCVALIAWLSKRFVGKRLIQILQIVSSAVLIAFAAKTLAGMFSLS